MEEEPQDFEWNRLSELQRRNTLCLPHMRTCYPVETQVKPPAEMADDDLKRGNGPAEDKPTQHIRYSTSEDGIKWSEPQNMQYKLHHK